MWVEFSFDLISFTKLILSEPMIIIFLECLNFIYHPAIIVLHWLFTVHLHSDYYQLVFNPLIACQTSWLLSSSSFFPSSLLNSLSLLFHVKCQHSNPSNYLAHSINFKAQLSHLILLCYLALNLVKSKVCQFI